MRPTFCYTYVSVKKSLHHNLLYHANTSMNTLRDRLVSNDIAETYHRFINHEMTKFDCLYIKFLENLFADQITNLINKQPKNITT